MGDECGGGRVCTVKDDEHTAGGGAEDDARNASEFKSADFPEDVEPVRRIGRIDRERTTDDLDLMRKTRVRDVRAASRDLLGREP